MLLSQDRAGIGFKQFRLVATPSGRVAFTGVALPMIKPSEVRDSIPRDGNRYGYQLFSEENSLPVGVPTHVALVRENGKTIRLFVGAREAMNYNVEEVMDQTKAEKFRVGCRYHKDKGDGMFAPSRATITRMRYFNTALKAEELAFDSRSG
jgi:negative regulator of sigma E activity